MAITNFIPEVWSSRLLLNFREAAIWASLANREYEGELSAGNTIHIPGIVDVAIKDYKAAGRITNADAISDTGTNLIVDQEKNFDFYVDDIDRAQAGRSFDAYTQSASNGLVEDADSFLANLAVTGGTALANTTAPTNAQTAFGVINELRTALNKAKVPLSERVLVVSSVFEPYLVGYDSKLTAADTSGSTAGLREATIGRLLGFDVVSSSALPGGVDGTTTGETAQAVAMHRSALAYVSQISETEALRGQDKFADRIRGLHVYGAKALRPSAIQVYTAATE